MIGLNIKILLISLIFIYQPIIFTEEFIQFNHNDYKKFRSIMHNQKKVILYDNTQNNGNTQFKEIRIYSIKYQFEDNNIKIFINENEYPIEKLYIYYKDNYYNLITLIKNENINIPYPKVLTVENLPVDSFEYKIKTPSNISNLNVFEKNLVDQINELRNNPKQYANKLKERLKYFRGNTFIIPDKISIKTKEGQQAVHEAIDVLEKTSPMQLLNIHQSLNESSKYHVNDIGPKGIVSHNSSNGETAYKRILRFGKFNEIGEVISFGIFDPEEIVIQFLIDDGVYDRGHRKNLLHPSFKLVGVSCGYHKLYDFMCTVNFGN